VHVLRAAEKMGKATYAAVVHAACGKAAKWGLLAAIFANCLGMCVVFLVIYAGEEQGAGCQEGVLEGFRGILGR
jgi:amino acid permease